MDVSKDEVQRIKIDTTREGFKTRVLCLFFECFGQDPTVYGNESEHAPTQQRVDPMSGGRTKKLRKTQRLHVVMVATDRETYLVETNDKTRLSLSRVWPSNAHPIDRFGLACTFAGSFAGGRSILRN